MNRRFFLQAFPTGAAALALTTWGCATMSSARPLERRVMTVLGPVTADELGVTLTQEHAPASFAASEEQARDPQPYDAAAVEEVVLPHLERLSHLGCRTFVDCTAVALGRDPELLRRLSEETGLNILTVTGAYAAGDNAFLPSYVQTDSVDALAQRWIDEAAHGIEGTDVRPGLIKLGLTGGPLSEVERKLIRAAAIAHLETGLTIAAHTPLASAAHEQLAILEQAGVAPSAWIWAHAQEEPDLTQRIEAARRGAWISVDGVAPDTVAAHVDMVARLRDEGLLGRVLVSQDAGSRTVGEPGGEDFRPYDTVFTAFIPALWERGFADSEVEALFVRNPAEAFALGVRTTA